MTEPRDHLIDGLRSAHAVEAQAMSLLQNQIDRLENYPEMLPRLQDHLRETEQQAENLERCLRSLGSDASSLKDFTTKFVANVQGLFHMATTDEVLKNTLASHAFERFEAASYQSLIVMARAAGEPDVERVAREHLAQEEAMADWVFQNIPMITEKYLMRSAADQTAKR